MGTERNGLPRLSPPLTEAERSYLWRRRHGLNQSEMAKRVGMHPDTLQRRERGQAGRLGGTPGASQLVPSAPEICVIRRRRAGWTQWRVANAVGVSRHAVMHWEKGRYEWRNLVAFWGAN